MQRLSQAELESDVGAIIQSNAEGLCVLTLDRRVSTGILRNCILLGKAQAGEDQKKRERQK
jgi:hypothetical protein